MKRDRHKDRSETRHQRDYSAHQRGAKTFRRGRAIAFLEKMELRRSTLKKQLETPELQTINSILVGELKAIDMVIDEYVELFELYEFYEEKKEDEIKNSLLDSKEKKENN